ncbi:MAG: nickel-dependent lactate racemase [Anaerolineae bacterium]|nr:nickel-dependent lactate racemase [Anaerolineae bacterium]NIN93888.1 nickel-dependent lactate racemase [Anaerolineae bacterium]NIQ76921.1 nickel-dependent lactate racemase [Anaerolineae bacterium]
MAPLSQVIGSLENRTAVIISEDQTRPSPVGSVAVPLINELNRLGIADKDIDVIIGRGTHREITQDEMTQKLGDEVLSRIKVSVHDADDNDNLVNVGTTSRGTPVWANRRVVEAGFSVGIGTINPHYFAGYGGGPKLILPGISGRDTIRHNHVLIREPGTVQGNMEGNPLWEDMLEAARLVGLDMKIDCLLNSETKIYKLFVGDVDAAQKEAVRELTEVYGAPVPRLADVTITSAFPLETNLIQSGKSILLADDITKPGGTVILLSACPDGAGPLMYETLAERPDPEEVVDWIAEGKASTTGGPMASRLRRLLATKSLMVVTEGLTPQQLADMEMEHATSIEDATVQVSRRQPKAEVIVLPIGGSTFPYVQEALEQVPA